MVRIGLTGGIGSGKTAVAALMAEHGAIVVDADALARDVVAPGTPGLAAVVAEFGPDVTAADGELDRSRLAAIVFADDAALHRLNAIVHPLVADRTVALLAKAPEDAVLVHDVPLLVENGLADHYDLVVVVEAPAAVRVNRLTAARGMSETQALARMRAQASDEQRRVVADVVIVNDGTTEDLRSRVDAVWSQRVVPIQTAAAG